MPSWDFSGATALLGPFAALFGVIIVILLGAAVVRVVTGLGRNDD